MLLKDAQIWGAVWARGLHCNSVLRNFESAAIVATSARLPTKRVALRDDGAGAAQIGKCSVCVKLRVLPLTDPSACMQFDPMG